MALNSSASYLAKFNFLVNAAEALETSSADNGRHTFFCGAETVGWTAEH
jgi:hypothetical protein